MAFLSESKLARYTERLWTNISAKFVAKEDLADLDVQDEIYVGTGEMPEGYVLQINPEGEVVNLSGLPVPEEDDAGKVVVVDDEGKYALGEAGATITVDPTLTQEGMAADAKAVGDAIKVEVIDVAEIDPGIFYDPEWKGELSESQAARFRSFRNGQMIKIINSVFLEESGIDISSYGIIYHYEDHIRFTCTFEFVNGIYYLKGYIPQDNYAAFWIDEENISADNVHNGTFAGTVRAGTNYQSPSSFLLRNSKLVTADTNPSNNGEISWTYE